MSTPQDERDQQGAVDAPDQTPSSLRGTIVAVLLMATFFVVAWYGVFALMLSRR